MRFAGTIFPRRVSIIFLLIFSLFMNLLLKGQEKIIFDTDFGGDADDLGALVMLHHFMDRKECELLAVISWSTEKYAVPAIDAINRYYGHPAIPIGVRKDAGHISGWSYSEPLAQQFPYQVDQETAHEATALYRELLADSPDQSIVLVTVGPLKNIENLLRSGPDKFSPLSGAELIKKKVREAVIMGGQFPTGTNEWNFNGDMPGVTRFVLENLPVSVTFSGYEVGVQIKTGQIFNQMNQEHPLYVGFKYFSQNAPWMKEHFKGRILDNASYDQTAVLYAVRKGIGTYWTRSERGICLADDHGGNRWKETNEGTHTYLKLAMDPEALAQVIESMMLNTY